MWWPLLVTDSDQFPRAKAPFPWNPQVQGYFTFYYLMSLRNDKFSKLGLLLLVGKKQWEDLPHKTPQEDLWLRIIYGSELLSPQITGKINHSFYCGLIFVNCVREVESYYNIFLLGFVCLLAVANSDQSQNIF